MLIGNLDETSIRNLSEYIDNYKQCEEWAINICCDGKKGGAYKKRWTTLIQKIQSTVKINENILDKYFGKTITENFDVLVENKELILKLKSILLKKDKISKFDLLINSNLNKIINLSVVNNKPLRTAEDCEFVLNSIDLQNSRKDLSIIWDELMAENGMSKFKDLDLNEPEKIAEKYIESINEYLNWYAKNYNKLIDLLGNANIPDQIVLKINNLDKDIDQINKIFDSIQNILPSIVEICLNQIKIDNNRKDIENRRRRDAFSDFLLKYQDFPKIVALYYIYYTIVMVSWFY